MSPRRAEPGELALVLHTHMPYVEGFGTWPFGEEWLWEAIATSYLPLLDVLAAPGGESVTLSVTPVLADQLEQPEAMERCLRFLEEIRPESHRLDVAELAAAGQASSPPSWSARRPSTPRRRGGCARSRPRAGCWRPWRPMRAGPRRPPTRSCRCWPATPARCCRCRPAWRRTGAGSAAGRVGSGCPNAPTLPWLDALLEDAGVRATCVELTGRFGLGDPRHLQPLAAGDGPVLWPVDRATMALVWSTEGYPSRAAYRDSHRHTTHRHHAWRNDGAPYHHGAALAQARADAAEFVGRVRERVAGGGACVCALDTELLGHWWYEGIHWLGAVLAQAAEQGLALTTLNDALQRHPPVPAPEDMGVTSWGEGGDLRTWSGPQVADLAWRARTAELRLQATPGRPADRALRELLALQSSDWAFLHTRDSAGDYPRRRADAHHAAFERALAGGGEPRLRGLAPDLSGWS